MVDPARGVVVCRWVGRREPFSNVLLYLIPCGRVSVPTMQDIERGDHEHFISSMMSLASLTSGRTTVQRKVGNWPDGLRTPHSLSYGHRDVLLYQAI